MNNEVIFGFANSLGKRIGYSVWCPGCKRYHEIWVYQPNPTTGAKWKFNGNLVRPTFSPSLHVEPGTKQNCHSFIKNGNWEFLPDCHHELKGKTVPMLPIED